MEYFVINFDIPINNFLVVPGFKLTAFWMSETIIW
jgi:hypothetical protein